MSSTRPLTLADFETTEDSTQSSGDFLQSLLQNQLEMTAVEAFSLRHDKNNVPDQAKYYSKLMPTSELQPGQQYAFEVELDRCSGCKACVTACHSLNGLDENETWRDVGLLIGGTQDDPLMQHVTTACHHCIEPGCLIACPVNAYEKDPVTGIVRHLDDQCFGCQYCTLACPYNVPKYHSQKGIVRKCDMCADRLAVNEAPACVQACPHEAISIQIVDIETIKENAEADSFLPAAPEPHLTLPTTNYKTSKVFPRNTLPADYFSISPQHPHWPLILMLVLTQLSVGAFGAGCVVEAFATADIANIIRPLHATSSLIFGLLALAASTLHLGRPQFAFRGFLGFRHSWLSREIVAFGAFAGLAVAYSGLCWVAAGAITSSDSIRSIVDLVLGPAGLSVFVSGMIGVFCSVMIYVFTKRELWSFDRTLLRFSLTTCLLGTSTTLMTISVLPAIYGSTETMNQVTSQLLSPLCIAVIASSAFKLLFDVMLFRHLLEFRYSSLKRSAMLSIQPLWKVTLGRFVLGVLGGLILPSMLLRLETPPSIAPLVALSVISWTSCLLGEMLERYLFFAVVAAPRMPGGVRP